MLNGFYIETLLPNPRLFAPKDFYDALWTFE
jgi:hypothetical protein